MQRGARGDGELKAALAVRALIEVRARLASNITPGQCDRLSKTHAGQMRPRGQTMAATSRRHWSSSANASTMSSTVAISARLARASSVIGYFLLITSRIICEVAAEYKGIAVFG